MTIAKKKGSNLSFFGSTYSNIVDGDDVRISPELKALLSQNGLSSLTTDYIVNQKPVQLTKSFAMLCCSPGTTHMKYHGLYYAHLKKFGEKWRFYYISEMDFPTEEEIQEFHVVIIPGSPCASYKDYDWKEAYFQLLTNIRNNYPKVLMLGICFGAQTFADCFGGGCEKMPNEFLRGSEPLAISESFFELPYIKNLEISKTGQLTISESHGDHIVKLPADAILHASSRRTHVEIYTMGDRILALQGHPEYTEQWTAAIVYNKNKETKDFAEFSEESRKKLYPEPIDHKDLMSIAFSFSKTYSLTSL